MLGFVCKLMWHYPPVLCFIIFRWRIMCMVMKIFHFFIQWQPHCLLGMYVCTLLWDSILCLCVCSFSIGLSITLTATQLITERKEGVIDRTWVAGGLDITSCDLTWSHPIAGVTVTEIIISQTFSFFFMAVAQSLPLFFVITYTYDVSLVIILAYSTTLLFCYSSLEKAALC